MITVKKFEAVRYLPGSRWGQEIEAQEKGVERTFTQNLDVNSSRVKWGSLLLIIVVAGGAIAVGLFLMRTHGIDGAHIGGACLAGGGGALLILIPILAWLKIRKNEARIEEIINSEECQRAKRELEVRNEPLELFLLLDDYLKAGGEERIESAKNLLRASLEGNKENVAKLSREFNNRYGIEATRPSKETAQALLTYFVSLENWDNIRKQIFGEGKRDLLQFLENAARYDVREIDQLLCTLPFEFTPFIVWRRCPDLFAERYGAHYKQQSPQALSEPWIKSVMVERALCDAVIARGKKYPEALVTLLRTQLTEVNPQFNRAATRPEGLAEIIEHCGAERMATYLNGFVPFTTPGHNSFRSLVYEIAEKFPQVYPDLIRHLKPDLRKEMLAAYHEMAKNPPHSIVKEAKYVPFYAPFTEYPEEVAELFRSKDWGCSRGSWLGSNADPLLFAIYKIMSAEQRKRFEDKLNAEFSYYKEDQKSLLRAFERWKMHELPLLEKVDAARAASALKSSTATGSAGSGDDRKS